MARNQSICIGNTDVIEGPYQETMDDPMKFSHQPSNGKRNHRTEQEFLYQLKMQIIEYMPKKISQPIMYLYSFFNGYRGSTLSVVDLSNNRMY